MWWDQKELVDMFLGNHRLSSPTNQHITWWNKQIAKSEFMDQVSGGPVADTWKYISELYVVASKVLSEDVE